MQHQTMSRGLFSMDYSHAKQQFCSQADSLGLVRSSIPVDGNLTIDIAHNGASESQDLLLVTSGLHGIEGFVGSAIQIAQMQQLFANADFANKRIAFVHALNPFGFAKLRRFDQDNVDLNRNFLTDWSKLPRANEHYIKLNSLLNPNAAKSRIDPFPAVATYQILRHGIATLKSAIATGQYHYPQGLFFGGQESTHNADCIAATIKEVIGDAERIIHLDIHSGLGPFASYKVLLIGNCGATVNQCEQRLGRQLVERFGEDGGVAYAAKGTLGQSLLHHHAESNYLYAMMEIGTYGPLRVLAALRKENQVHWHHSPDQPIYRKAKRELLECFCPASQKWRNKVIGDGTTVLNQLATVAP